MKPEGEVRIVHSNSLPVAVDLHLETYEGMGWIRQRLRGQRGWLQIGRASMDTFWGQWSATLVVGMTDKGQLLNTSVAHALLEMRSANPREPDEPPDDLLEGHMEMAYWDFLGRCDVRHLRMLEEAEAEMAGRIEMEQSRGEAVLNEVEAYISQLNRRRRLEPSEEKRRAIVGRIDLLEHKHAEASAWLVRRLAAMRRDIEQQEADILDALQNHGELEIVQTLYWVARHPADRRQQLDERRGFTPGGGVPADWRGSISPADALHRAERLGRMHSSIPPEVYRRERQELMAHREARGLAHQKDPLGELVKLSQRWNRASAGQQAGPVEPAAGEVEQVQAGVDLRRTAAQRDSARRRTESLERERAIADLLDQYPGLEDLERQLDSLPSTGIENRRKARLIRDAIGRLVKHRTATLDTPNHAAFPNYALVPTSVDRPATIDDSVDIDALIETELVEMLKDLRPE